MEESQGEVESMGPSVETLQRRLDVLESRLRSMESQLVDTSDKRTDRWPIISRRTLFGGMALAAIPALLSETRAEAANTDPVRIGQPNEGSLTTTLQATVSTTPSPVLQINAGASGTALSATASGSQEGVIGTSDGAADAAGVVGKAKYGYGLYGESVSGYAVFAGGNGRVGLASHVPTAPPVSNSYGLGDIVRDAAGEMFLCVVAGSPGQWRKIGGPTSAGQFHVLNPPTRTIDTRSGAKPVDGNTVTVTLPNAVPLSANAVALNLTATGTDAVGWLAVYSPASGFSGTSSLNWDSANTTIANGVIAPCSNRTVAVRVRGSSHFIVDVLGYWY